MEGLDLFQLRKFIIPEIIHGPGSIALASQHSENLVVNRVLLVTDLGVNNTPWPQKVRNSLYQLNIPFVDYISPFSKACTSAVEQGATLYHQKECDIILAIGGGNVMDTAKGIGIRVTNNEPLCNYRGINNIPLPTPPTIVIPTTTGNGSNISQFAFFIDDTIKEKFAILSPLLMPDITIVDHKCLTTQTASQLADCGISVICQAIEAYTSKGASPLTDMAALSSIQEAHHSLLRFIKSPESLEEYTESLMNCNIMAASAFSNANSGIGHALSQALITYIDIGFGECYSMILPWVIDFNTPVCEKKYNDITKIFNPKRPLSEEITHFRKTLGFSSRLKDFNLSNELLEKCVLMASNCPCLVTNPCAVTRADLLKIYKLAM